MSSPPPGDVEGDPLPVVARPGSGMPAWLLVVGVALVALLLFGVLDAPRRAAESPSVAPRAVDAEAIAPSLPPLEVPADPAPAPPLQTPAPPVPVARMGAPPSQAPVMVRMPPANTPAYSPPGPARTIEPAQRPVSSGSAVIVDNPVVAPDANNRQGGNAGGNAATGGEARVRASMLANRATTVPQGTLIPAVLETGFDSTRAGYARAIVQHDIRGFDGQRVLIPRGSRMIGEYQSDARPGQNRALIIWNRLLRPDGATIEIASPAADTVGRGGIKADVNSHFFQRFSGAILQSALNAGVEIASQRAGGTTVVALPYGAAAGSSSVQPTTIPPTLKVRPGTSISVFVARDLDFTGVEDRP